MPLWEITTIIGAAVASAMLCVLWLTTFRRAAPSSPTPATSDRVSFLFEGDVLHHASCQAVRRHNAVPGLDTWSNLSDQLRKRFPDFPETPILGAHDEQVFFARHVEDIATVVISNDGAFTQVAIHESPDEKTAVSNPSADTQRDLENLRRACETSPHPTWQRDQNNQVIWFNAAYRALYNELHGSAPDSAKEIFDNLQNPSDHISTARICVTQAPEQKPRWFDIHAVRVGKLTVFHAADVNAVVESEVAQKNFVQTLAKTFAQLSIGLAIFNRQGQLALFNPALVDLTGLPAQFLSGQPTLHSFFDSIREKRRMPEPKDYHSWRQEISELIVAATGGRYQETWSLETGQTYRVSGRPHPDGAIAFLIEDISAEILMTRNFRAELELSQSLLDTFSDAIVVFYSTGVLAFCNLAYRNLWDLDPDNSFADVTIMDSVMAWEAQCQPGARWSTLTEFVLDFGRKTVWSMPITLTSGAELSCEISRIASGATVIRFSKLEVSQPTPKHITAQN